MVSPRAGWLLALTALACSAAPSPTQTASPSLTPGSSASPLTATPTAGASPSPTAQPTATAAALPTITPDAAWSVDSAPFDNNGTAERFWADGDYQLWALGDSGAGAAMWVTEDGRSWSHVDGLSVDLVRGDTFVDLVANESGYVVVGCAYPRNLDVCGSPLVWHLAHGASTWTRRVLPGADELSTPIRVVDFGHFVAFGDGCVRHMAALPGQVVTALTDDLDCLPHPRVWSSLDGKKWVDVSPTPPDGWISTNGLALSTAEGLAIGGNCEGGGTAWLTYSFGPAWTVAPCHTGPRLQSVAAGPQGMVGVASDLAGVTVWQSADGEAWSMLGTVSESRGWYPLGRLTWTGSAFVLFMGSDTGEASVWTSTVGSRWSRSPVPEAVARLQVSDAIVFDGNLVLASGDQIALHPLPFP